MSASLSFQHQSQPRSKSWSQLRFDRYISAVEQTSHVDREPLPALNSNGCTHSKAIACATAPLEWQLISGIVRGVMRNHIFHLGRVGIGHFFIVSCGAHQGSWSTYICDIKVDRRRQESRQMIDPSIVCSFRSTQLRDNAGLEQAGTS